MCRHLFNSVIHSHAHTIHSITGLPVPRVSVLGCSFGVSPRRIHTHLHIRSSIDFMTHQSGCRICLCALYTLLHGHNLPPGYQHRGQQFERACYQRHYRSRCGDGIHWYALGVVQSLGQGRLVYLRLGTVTVRFRTRAFGPV